jgi:deoxyribodipyrimidine photolyase-related protein
MKRRGSEFQRALKERLHGPGSAERTWVFVPYDQLNDGLGILRERAPEELGIVLVESPAKAARRPYHKQKLALVLANLRHFALEQAARGVDVRHVVAGPEGYRGAVERAARELGPLVVHAPAERELRVELRPLVGSAVIARPHTGWLTSHDQFARATGGKAPYRMDTFYRLVRRETGILMERGKPVGGKLSFDTENRKPWRGSPPAPEPPRFTPDPVTDEVGRLVQRHYAEHPGEIDLTTLPATEADADTTWRWARETCLPHFGPYEDAMSRTSSGLFHTRISALLNLHRLLPARVIHDVLALDIPLASREGFVRQVLGWREFVRHVHRATDGFRKLPSGPEPEAAPSFLGAHRPLPNAYWGKRSGLACLDHVVADVFREGYSHHITRLMVLGNLATLLDVSPRALTDWFWFAYVDAYDWVVEPNVLAMATFGAGELMTTKPYVAGSAYIDRMGDYCGACRFSPGSTCPITRLYWAFLGRHEAALAGNVRIAMPLRSLAKRSADERARDARVFDWVSRSLAHGDTLTPDGAPD